MRRSKLVHFFALVASLILAACTAGPLPTPAPTSGPSTGPTLLPTAEATVRPDLTPVPTTTPSPSPALTSSPSPVPSSSVVPTPTPKTSPTPVGPLVPVWYHGSRTRKIVALTFDDGWSPPNTLKILAILEREKVPATFFPVGRVIVAYPDTWRKVVAAGFPLGNHTYSHATLTHHDKAWILADLAHQRQVVKDILHTTMLPLLRPPGGAWNKTTQAAAAADGDQALILWDIDTRDWAGPSPSVETRRALGGTDGSIVLMHASLDNTPAALPDIIAGYRARGFTFVTLGQMFGIPGAMPTFGPTK